MKGRLSTKPTDQPKYDEHSQQPICPHSLKSLTRKMDRLIIHKKLRTSLTRGGGDVTNVMSCHDPGHKT